MAHVTTATRRGRTAASVDERKAADRMLDAAEQLFAEHGITEVGLRAISAAAKVNIAAVSYYFGSKEALVEEVFRRRATKIADERNRGLDVALAEPDADRRLEKILRVFLESGFSGDTPEATARFAKLRARINTEDTALARRLLSESFDDGSRRFLAAIADIFPHLDAAEIGWRFHAMLGIMVYTMANSGRIQALTDGRVDPSNYLAAIDRLLPTVTAIFRRGAPPALPDPSLQMT
jgi:AcrR family transcriptional regulator